MKYVSTKHSNIPKNRFHLPVTDFFLSIPRRPSFPSLRNCGITLFNTFRVFNISQGTKSLSLGFKTEGNYRYTSDVVLEAPPGSEIKQPDTVQLND